MRELCSSSCSRRANSSLRPAPAWLALASLLVLSGSPACGAKKGPASSASNPAQSGPPEVFAAPGQVPAPASASALSPMPSPGSARLPFTPSSVQPVAEPACVLEASDWSPDRDDSAMRVRPGGAPFARPIRGKVVLELPHGRNAESVFARIARHGWEISGHLEADDISLRPSVPIVFDGWLVPLAVANLGWEETRAGELVVTFTPSRGIRAANGVLRATRKCAEVTLESAGRFEPATALPRVAHPRKGVLRARPNTPLSVEPGKPAVAFLDLPNGDEQVDVLESRGAFTRIAWEHFEETIFGWVPVGDVRTQGPGPAGGYNAIGGIGGGGTGEGIAGQAAARYRCSQDTPLLVEVRGETVIVGRILAGTRVEVRDRIGGFMRPVVPPEAPFVALPGASFLVRSSDLEGCRGEK